MISYSTISFGVISISEIIKLWNTLSSKYLGYNIIRFVSLQEMFMLLLAVKYGWGKRQDSLAKQNQGFRLGIENDPTLPYCASLGNLKCVPQCPGQNLCKQYPHRLAPEPGALLQSSLTRPKTAYATSLEIHSIEPGMNIFQHKSCGYLNQSSDLRSGTK